MALIVGNWKMNGTRSSLAEAKRIGAEAPEGHELAICPPATLLWAMAETLEGTPVKFGGQDCHPKETGAHTGRISAEMIAETGATYCIIGHSECRDECGDTDAFLREKVEAAFRAGLMPIFCVGESLETREAGNAVAFVTGQLDTVADVADRIVVAYEPIWAIGTGRVPSTEDIAEMHQAMRDKLGEKTPLLYGGSVKPGNAAEILAVSHVGGALVGGASLKADDFLGIARAG